MRNDHRRMARAALRLGLVLICQTLAAEGLAAQTALTPGVPVSNLSGGQDSWTYFYIDVPAGTTKLNVITQGNTSGSGDLDLYLRFGAQPTLSSFDCRPYLPGNTESCLINAPQTGRWHIGLHGFAAYTGVTLVADLVTGCSVNVSSFPSIAGTVTGGGAGSCGRSVTVQATPAAGFQFANWTENGSPVSTSASFTTTVSQDRVLVANYRDNRSGVQFKFTAGHYPETADLAAAIAAEYGPGYRLADWNDVKAAASNATSWANGIGLPNEQVAYVSLGGQRGPSSGVQYYLERFDNQTPYPGFAVYDEIGGQLIVLGAWYGLTMKALAIATQSPTCDLTVSASPGAAGTASVTAGGSSGPCNRSVTVSATPAAGYQFQNWAEGAVVVSTSQSYTFALTTNRSLVANFASVSTTCTVSVSAAPPAGGTATITGGGATGPCGRNVSVTASPAPNYQFRDWTEGAVVVSAAAVYTFAASTNRSLTANFTTPTPAGAIVLNIGSSPSMQTAPSGPVSIPLRITFASGAPDLGSLSANITFPQALLGYVSFAPSNVGTVVTNAAPGQFTIAWFDPSGRSTSFDLGTLTLSAGATQSLATIGGAITAAGTASGSNIASQVSVRSLSLDIKAGGLWGDVNKDQVVNIVDAQQIARASVGLSVANPACVSAAGDVNGDGSVNIVDAQQVARFAVGLPISGRVNTQGAGTC